MLPSLQEWLLDVLRGRSAALTVLAELVLIALAVYAILRFLRGTRAASLLRGVALLVLAATLITKIIAERFELDRILVI
ncbi:MAG: hypothetical protein V3T70_00875, partial [Phycisphaerae bacterium]